MGKRKQSYGIKAEQSEVDSLIAVRSDLAVAQRRIASLLEEKHEDFRGHHEAMDRGVRL